MTAQIILDSTKPLLSGRGNIASDDNILLSLLNLSKNQIALDTLLWLDGEEITMTTDRAYSLSKIPIQIIDVYDNEGNIRPRNSKEKKGYFQTKPNEITFNNPTEGTIVYVNYYDTPDDYALIDEVNIPSSLISAMQYYVAHKVYDAYTSQTETALSTEYFRKYMTSINSFISKTDSLDTDSVYGYNMIDMKGLI